MFDSIQGRSSLKQRQRPSSVRYAHRLTYSRGHRRRACEEIKGRLLHLPSQDYNRGKATASGGRVFWEAILMWCNKVLVAYDGSEPSRKAVDLALGVIKPRADIELHLVHIMRIYASGAAAAGIDTVLLDDVENIRQELIAIADSVPNPTVVEILKGSSPADLILNYVKKEGCDLIIMGNRGRGGVKGYLGSVSYAVTKDSPVNVLIAKDGLES